MPNAEDYIDLKIINDAKLQKLFTELVPATQNKIVLNGMRSAAQEILKQAKTNFKSQQKNKSKTGYKFFNRSFATEPMKGTFGLKVGVKNYKMRWLEWGTDERFVKKGRKRFFRYRKSLLNSDKDKRSTGKITGTHFFFKAVEEKKNVAINNINNAIIESFEKVIKKYESNNK
jgi:hypothetical protein